MKKQRTAQSKNFPDFSQFPAFSRQIINRQNDSGFGLPLSGK
jgi:hypothetical protein